MSELENEYLTTRELAALLRLKERKVYELAAAGDVPCSRATGKLLFPRRAVEAWIARNSSGPELDSVILRPEVFLGSHDPLLEWALRECGAPLATFFDGSHDGLTRFAGNEGIATGLHVYEPQSNDWNRPVVASLFKSASVVLIEFAWRERGLIVAPGNPNHLHGVDALRGQRVVSRQASAGSQRLFEHLCEQAGLEPGAIDYAMRARTESDAAIAVLDGNADAAFGLLGLAAQFRLGFVPVVRERFDLLVDRRAWFEPAMQSFVRFCRSSIFAEKAHTLTGYDVSGFGQVHFNGEC